MQYRTVPEGVAAQAKQLGGTARRPVGPLACLLDGGGDCDGVAAISIQSHRDLVTRLQLTLQPRHEHERPTRVVLSQTADITSNGRTFVVVQQPPMSEAALGAIVVVENWAERPRGDRPR